MEPNGSRITEPLFIDELARILPQPPLCTASIRPDSLKSSSPKKPRRRSKYTEEQDDAIISLKRCGKSWAEIAEVSGVGSALAVRNRYQVLVGQQGGENSNNGPEDVLALRALIDDGELEKWRYLARELEKHCGRRLTDVQCREVVRRVFVYHAPFFGITDRYLSEFSHLNVRKN